MNKIQRQRLIVRLIEEKGVKTQEELRDLLKSEGVSVTQVTISRDLKELNLFKATGSDGKLEYRITREELEKIHRERIRRVFRESIIGIESTNSLIVIQTLPGLAQGVALCVDELGWEEILGTIGGDDTIFIAVRRDADVEALVKRLRQFHDQ